MKKIYLGLAILASGFAMAQEGRVGVNTDAPSVTLEITPNATNAATTATSHEGILIPRVSRVRAANMGTGVPESTLVYINSLDGSAAGTTADVDANGFYYFAGGKWVKMGAGSTSGGGANFGNGTFTKVPLIQAANWNNNQFALAQTGAGSITLPPPTANRIIAIHNDTGSSLQYASPAPNRNSAIQSGKGQLLMSDGSKWYVIGGL